MSENIQRNDKFCVYAEQYQNMPVFVSCNMEADTLFRSLKYEYCVKIIFKIDVKKDTKELISREELESIGAIENRCLKMGIGVFVGHGIVTSQASAMLVFYVEKLKVNDFRDFAGKILSTTRRPFRILAEYDPHGKQYRDILHPDEYQMAAIDNIELLKELAQNGDSGRTPRQVLFRIYFKEVADLESCANEAEALGFALHDRGEEKDEEDDDDEYIYYLVLRQVIPFDVPTVNNMAFSLMKLADKFDGDYDGVESDVVNELN